MAPQYPHSASSIDRNLSHIRVLEVQRRPARRKTSSSNSSPLVCKRRVVSLNDNPTFVALSYVWGTQICAESIIVDGETRTITQNLHDALLWHRDNKPNVLIWVDAICINQDDVKEKNHQVRMMNRVYSQAAQVICWLGPATPSLEVYMQYRSSRVSRISNDWGRQTQINKAWLTPSRYTRWLRGETHDETVLRSLRLVNGETEFLQLPYFSRTWTFQEALLPRSAEQVVFVLGGVVYDGDWRAPLTLKTPTFAEEKVNSLRNCNRKMSTTEVQILDEFHWSQSHSRLGSRWAALMEAGLWQSKHRCQLWQLLTTTIGRRCRDPRDNIYALLGLMTPIEEDNNFGISKVFKPSHERVDSVMDAKVVMDSDVSYTTSLSLQAAREQYLAVDYQKDPNLVMYDALYYINHFEDAEAALRCIAASRRFICSTRQVMVGSNIGQGYGHTTSQDAPSWLPDLAKPPYVAPATTEGLFQEERMGSAQAEWFEHRTADHVRTLLQFDAKPIGEVIHTETIHNTHGRISAMVTPIAAQAVTKLLAETGELPELPAVTADTATIASTTSTNSVTAAQLKLLRGFADRLTAVVTRGLQTFGGDAVAERSNDIWKPASSEGPRGPPLTLFMLDTGRYGICENVVEEGDVVIASRVFDGCHLVRAVNDDEFETHTVVDVAIVEGLLGSQVDKAFLQSIYELDVEEIVLA